MVAVATRATTAHGRSPTVGVEEEFLLLDPATGAAVPAASALLARLAGEPGVRAELMRFQVETASPVCTDLAELHGQLCRLRELAAHAAELVGCRLVASGVAPYGTPGLAALTDDPRYRELARRYPSLTADSGTCACHVHIGVPSRQVGVQVLARLRPWLGTLLALTANSPIAEGRDTGWVSQRYRLWSRWPTATPPPVSRNVRQYDTNLQRLLRQGSAMDERSVYFLARLSPRYPTVEVRIADVTPDVDTAVLLAALVRALAADAVRDRHGSDHGGDRGGQPAPVGGPDLRGALTTAARSGLGGLGTDPATGRATVHAALLERLVDQVRPALDALGDTERVRAHLRRIEERGTGADRQRAAWSAATSPREFVAGLASSALPDRVPGG